MDAFEGERIALEIIDIIVDASAKTLYDHYIQEREIPFAAGCVLVDVFDVVRTAFLKRDLGEDKSDVDSSWVAEHEPPASQCDSWARGFVNVKKKKKKAAKSSKPEDPKAKPYNFRRSSKNPTANKKSKKKDKMDSFDDDEDESIDVLIRTVGTPTDPLEMGIKRRGGDKELTATEIANAKELKAIEDKAAAERERRQRMLEQEKAEIESHEKLVKELKGKDYTFDQNGKVILITQMSKDSLRPLHLNPGVSVTNLLANDEKKARKRKGGKKKNFAGTDSFSNSNLEFFTSSVLQPSILSTVSLNPGVEILEGEKKKTGPRRRAVDNKMSRSDFLSHQSLLESRSTSALSRVGPSPGGMNTLSASIDGAVAGSGGATAPGGGAGVPPLLKTSMSMPVANLASNNNIPSPVASNPATKDVEQRAQMARVARTSKARPGDANLLLTQSADWGQNLKGMEDFNPSPVPAKQSDKQKELQTKLMGGERVKNLRDRPYISSTPTANRKKLPPPPLGVTTGHGVSIGGSDTFLPSIRSTEESVLSSSRSKVGFKSIKASVRGGKINPGQKVGELL